MRRTRSIMRAAIVLSALAVLATPLLTVGTMIWQMHGPASTPTGQSRVVFDSRSEIR